MANVLDYIAWRGDLDFDKAPFCDVDGLILCRLSYIPFDDVVPGGFDESIALREAAEMVLELIRAGKRAVRIKDDEALLKALIGSERFCALQLTGYVNVYDERQQEQFSATTAILPGDAGAYVAFRGTDGTLVGWKEDFNMGFADSVPAQQDAVAYLEAAAAGLKGPLYVGGHSKGGNLAVYASAFCSEKTQQRILEVRNNDGPGFNEDRVHSAGFERIVQRTRTFLPQSSVVGMLLEHAEDFSVVHSVNTGLAQHNIYSWEVLRSGFVAAEGLTNSSQFMDSTLKDWVKNMPAERREKLIDGLFAVASASDGKTLRELWNGRNTIAVLKAAGNMDEETKAVIAEALHILRTSMKRSLPAVLERITAGLPPLREG